MRRKTTDTRPLKSRKLPSAPPAPVPDVTPEIVQEDAEPVPHELKLSGGEAEVPEEDFRREDGTFTGNNPHAQTPAANAKRSQSVQVSHSLRRMLGLTLQQFEQVVASPGSVADQIACKLVQSAQDGVMDAIKTIYDRTEGRVPQALEVSNTAHKDVNERVSDIARDRANAAALAAAGELPSGEEVLDVPEDGAEGSEAADSTPGVEEGSPGAGAAG